MEDVSDSITDDKAIESLIVIRAEQRRLVKELIEADCEIKVARKLHDQQDRQLASLQYEQGHLVRQLESCRNFQTTNLVLLARGERGQNGGDKLSSQGDEQCMQQFLGADIHNPDDREKIVAKLQGEIANRRKLEAELKAKQRDLLVINDDLARKKLFLSGLPDQIITLERASLPLQRFMSTKSPGNGPLTGSKRQERLDHARSLPSPLFSLFSLMQNYLDRTTTKMTLSVANTETDQPYVVLQIPLPSSTKAKRVSIQFRLVDDHIAAIASGCSSSLYQDVVLDELFPGDDSEPLDEKVGKAYHWCNALAGQYVVTTQAQRIGSVKVVMTELARRVRANSTLRNILSSLLKLRIPKTGNDSATSGCMLSSFTSMSGDNATCRTFEVVLKQGNKDRKMHVTVNMSRYPAIPPTWSLNFSNDTGKQLHSSRLVSLQSYVNSNGLEALVAEDMAKGESAYESILVYQLKHIMENIDSC